MILKDSSYIIMDEITLDYITYAYEMYVTSILIEYIEPDGQGSSACVSTLIVLSLSSFLFLSEQCSLFRLITDSHAEKIT